MQVLELVVRYILTPHIYYIIFSLHAIYFPVLGAEVFVQYPVLVTVAVWDCDITNVAYNVAARCHGHLVGSSTYLGNCSIRHLATIPRVRSIGSIYILQGYNPFHIFQHTVLYRHIERTLQGIVHYLQRHASGPGLQVCPRERHKGFILLLP